MLNDAVSISNHMEGTTCCVNPESLPNKQELCNEWSNTTHMYVVGCYLMHRLDDDVMLWDWDAVAVHWPAGGYTSCLFLCLSHKATQDRSQASRIPQNCQILVCMHVHTPAHMCVRATLPSSFLPASSLALHQGWWGSVYGKCEESNFSCFKISPLTCSSSLPFLLFSCYSLLVIRCLYCWGSSCLRRPQAARF